MAGKMVQTGAVGLTRIQRVFVEEYLRCWNAAEAARLAGYSEKDAKSRGYKLLKRAEVQAVIRERLQEKAMGSDEVLARLAEQARGSVGDYLVVEGEEGKEQVRFDLVRLVKEGKGHLLRTVTVNKVRIEFYNAQAALELLAKHQGLFREQKAQEESSGTISLAEWEEMVEERMARVSALMLKWGMVTPEELGVGERREGGQDGLEGVRLLTG
jgi:hypothetical protein